VIRLWRYPCALAVAVACFTTAASADLKIKTRTTVMGHTTESTVYIKGARERNEMSFGGHGGTVSITQCDQKRIITISGNQCMVMSMGGGETSCPATPNMAAMAREGAEGEPTPSRKGGVVTITRTSTDTGERQEMFGYKARHIKTSMVMESSPDACNQSHMKTETDGWYADLSAGFSCSDESYRAMACGGGGGKRGCRDRIVVKGGGSGALGYPLKQTTTMVSEHGTFTTTTEVVELASANLEAPLFEMPPGCKGADMSAMMGGAPASHAEAAAEPAPAKVATPPAAPPAPALAPKAAGTVRVGVVKIKDMSDQSLPTDNLRLNLMSEIGRHQMEAVPLDAEAPQTDVESEASAKQCDYILYTVSAQVKEAGKGGLPPASLPRGVILDPAKFQALTDVTLYKVGKPVPELKDLALAADATQFGVNAVMATFVIASDRVAQQITEDAHPKPAAKPAKAPTKGTSSTKPK
jgi:hypothetical protein